MTSLESSARTRELACRLRVDAYVEAVRRTVRQLRYARGVLLHDVAEHIRVSPSTISRMETGIDNRLLRIHDLVGVCDALEVPPVAVFEHAHRLYLENGGTRWQGSLPSDMGCDNRIRDRRSTPSNKA